MYFYPKIVLEADKSNLDVSAIDAKEFSIYSCDAQTVDEGKSLTNSQWTYPNTSGLKFSTAYLGNNGESGAHDTITVDTYHATMSSRRFATQSITPIIDTNNPLPVFRMKRGTNICRIRFGWDYQHMYLYYTPLYRMGAF